MVQRHRRMIRAICLWHATGGAVECDDLVQEVLAALWHYRHRLREGATPEEERAWVRFHCRSVVQHQYRRKRVETVRLDEQMPLADAPQADARERIAELATDLTAHERKVMEMTLDGYEADDIARELGIKSRSVVQIRWRIVKKMKQKSQEI